MKNLKENLKAFVLGAALFALIGASAALGASIVTWLQAPDNTIVPPQGIAIGQSMPSVYMATAVASTTGYFFTATALDFAGRETANSYNEINATTSATATTSAITVTWSPVQGALSYKLYFGTKTGGENQYVTSSLPSYTFATTTGATSMLPPTLDYAFTNYLSANGSSYLSNQLAVNHINGITGATVATGTAAGTGATTTIAYATDLSRAVTLHTGTAAMGTSTPIFTLTFQQAYPKAPACVLFPENAVSAAIAAGATPYMIPGTTSTAAYANATALATSTTYMFGWVCSN